MRELNKSFDYLSKDYKGYKQEMIRQLKILMPEYTDLSETDAGIVILELAAVGLDILSAYLDSQANESLLTSAELWSSVVKWAKILAYEPKYATPSTIKQVFKLSKELDEDFVVPSGTLISTSPDYIEGVVYFETTGDLTIPSGSLGDEQDENGDYLYTATAQQGSTVSLEQIGISKGIQNQEFSLGYSPAIYDSIYIVIDGFIWTKAENNSLVNHGKDDNVFTITVGDYNTTIISFGDGVFGKIPEANSVIYANYRVGGGTVGNVTEGAVKVLTVSNARIAETFNTELIEKGQDRESIDRIKMSAPALSRTTWGALTLTDFTDVTLSKFRDITKAKTIRGDATDTFGITVEDFEGNVVTPTVDDIVIGVYPDIMHTQIPQRIVSEFDSRRLAGMDNIYIVPIDTVEITHCALSIGISQGYENLVDNIKAEVKTAFINFFSANDNIAIDGDVIISDIENYIVKNVRGVALVRITSITDYTGTTANNPQILRVSSSQVFKLLTCTEDSLNTFTVSVI